MMSTSNFRKQLENIRLNAVCRVYAVHYTQKGRKSNRSIVLPEQTGKELSEYFWKSISDDEEESEQIEVSGKLMMEKWEDLENLLHNAIPYESGNIEEIRKCNLYICEAKYGDERYYFCSRQNKQIKALLQHAAVVSENESELAVKGLKEVCLMNTQVDFIVDPSQNRIVFRDSKVYKKMFEDEEWRKLVRQKLNVVDNWTFIVNVSFIKERVSQKNVYSKLYRIFNRQEYLDEIKRISSERFKWFLLHKYSEKFTEADFSGEKLIITGHNMENFLKILAKGIDTVWLIIDDEQSTDEAQDEMENDSDNEDELVLPWETIEMCKKVCYGFVLEEDEQKSREEQIRRFLKVLNQVCQSDLTENNESEKQAENKTESKTENKTENEIKNRAKDKTEKKTTGIFEYFHFNGVKLRATIHGKETWFEINEDSYQEAYANDNERELLIKGLCTDTFFKLLLSDTKKRE